MTYICLLLALLAPAAASAPLGRSVRLPARPGAPAAGLKLPARLVALTRPDVRPGPAPAAGLAPAFAPAEAPPALAAPAAQTAPAELPPAGPGAILTEERLERLAPMLNFSPFEFGALVEGRPELYAALIGRVANHGPWLIDSLRESLTAVAFSDQPAAERSALALALGERYAGLLDKIAANPEAAPGLRRASGRARAHFAAEGFLVQGLFLVRREYGALRALE
ncbi:MAG: hypothetical protein PHF00_07750 [Elusimicrobia bacterium]|nr:hypothetical protein [Elusimicrobiota bacterium]